MAKTTQSMYFLFKVVAPIFSKPRLRAASTAETMVTKDSMSMSFADEAGESCSVRVGGKPGTLHHGVAGHFTGHYLNFSDIENARCKTLAEAEQLAKKNHHQFLANAYDWFVAPVEIGSVGASSRSKPASRSTKAAGAKKTPRK